MEAKPYSTKFSFRLGAGDRVGLVGKNGAGKSTLLHLIARDNEPTAGSIATEKNLSVGFLRQDIDFEKGRTVLEEAYQVFTEIKQLEAEMEEVNQALASRTDYESEEYNQLIISLNDLTERYALIGDIIIKEPPSEFCKAWVLKQTILTKRPIPSLAVGVCVLSWRSSFCKTTMCCYSMSRPTTWISSQLFG